MNFLKRAFLSVKRRLSKTLLLLLVTTVICLLTLSGISIQTSSQAASVLARQKLGAEVTLRVDTEKMRENMMKDMQSGNPGEKSRPSMTPLPMEYIEILNNSEYVQDYYATISTSLIANDFESVGAEESSESQAEQNPEMRMPQEMRGGKNMGDATLIGVTNFEETPSYKGGSINLKDGTSEITEDNQIIIEETLATQNELKVGDKINVSTTADDSTEIELEIVGIYTTSESFTEQAMMNPASSPYNTIYTNLTTASSLKGESYDSAVDSATFYINDPVNVEAFLEESKNTSIDFDTFILDANNASYEKMMGPIENISSFAKIAVVVISISGAVILSLIIMLTVRERVQEIGILLSLGEKKVKIAGQFIVEMLLILLMSVCISGALGGYVSNAIASNLLTSELSVEENVSTQQHQGGPMGNDKGFGGKGFGNMFTPVGQDVESIDELNVNITSQDFAKMTVVGVLISLIATATPVISVMRLNPKNILSKHS